MFGRQIDGSPLNGFRQLQKKSRQIQGTSRHQISCRVLTSQERIKRKEGRESEGRWRKRRRLKLRIVVHPRASTIGQSCQLFFTLLLCQSVLVLTSFHLLFLFSSRHQPLSKMQGQQYGNFVMSMFLNQPTQGSDSLNCCMQCSAMTVDSSKHLQRRDLVNIASNVRSNTRQAMQESERHASESHFL